MRVALVMVSNFAHEPRVRREGAALVEAGHEVVGLGLPGSSGAVDWPVTELEGPSWALPGKALTAVRQGVLGRVAPFAAYWIEPSHRRWARALRETRPDVVVAHDWSVLPIAAAARDSGAAVVYDSHEYGAEQGAGRPLWRLTFPHMVRAVERAHLHDCDGVVTVCDGIADALTRDYRLTERPAVVRNMPQYREMPFRETFSRIELLYQGVLNQSRGLEELVDSVGLWMPDRRLVIRGPGSDGYVESLRRRAEVNGVSDRVAVVDPVPPSDLLTAAAGSDVGVFIADESHGQLRFALPNKLFEFAMAGLAVMVSPLPEIERVCRSHDFGVFVDRPSPASIARAVNDLTPTSVDDQKRRSLLAAMELNWEHERASFLDVVDQALRRRSGTSSR